ncbi:MAG TPA: hypothetical protein VEK38_01545 [Candidatus Bathyarchaeia archaeon]|nr:hypothetical protein [Candidatus Bathyarchaeia archaeon]
MKRLYLLFLFVLAFAPCTMQSFNIVRKNNTRTGSFSKALLWPVKLVVSGLFYNKYTTICTIGGILGGAYYYWYKYIRLESDDYRQQAQNRQNKQIIQAALKELELEEKEFKTFSEKPELSDDDIAILSGASFVIVGKNIVFLGNKKRQLMKHIIALTKIVKNGQDTGKQAAKLCQIIAKKNEEIDESIKELNKKQQKIVTTSEKTPSSTDENKSSNNNEQAESAEKTKENAQQETNAKWDMLNTGLKLMGIVAIIGIMYAISNSITTT